MNASTAIKIANKARKQQESEKKLAKTARELELAPIVAERTKWILGNIKSSAESGKFYLRIKINGDMFEVQELRHPSDQPHLEKTALVIRALEKKGFGAFIDRDDLLVRWEKE